MLDAAKVHFAEANFDKLSVLKRFGPTFFTTTFVSICEFVFVHLYLCIDTLTVPQRYRPSLGVLSMKRDCLECFFGLEEISQKRIVHRNGFLG